MLRHRSSRERHGCPAPTALTTGPPQALAGTASCQACRCFRSSAVGVAMVFRAVPKALIFSSTWSSTPPAPHFTVALRSVPPAPPGTSVHLWLLGSLLLVSLSGGGGAWEWLALSGVQALWPPIAALPCLVSFPQILGTLLRAWVHACGCAWMCL